METIKKLASVTQFNTEWNIFKKLELRKYVKQRLFVLPVSPSQSWRRRPPALARRHNGSSRASLATRIRSAVEVVVSADLRPSNVIEVRNIADGVSARSLSVARVFTVQRTPSGDILV